MMKPGAVPYQESGSRVRHDYRLTRKGWDLRPVLVALRQWGEAYEGDPEGPVRSWTFGTVSAGPRCGSWSSAPQNMPPCAPPASPPGLARRPGPRP